MSKDNHLRVLMIAPNRERCGVAAYSRYLAEALASRVELSIAHDLRQAPALADMADIVHIQHQYFLFGGVAPWKNRFSSFVRQFRTPVVMTAHEFVVPTGPAQVRVAIRLTNRLQFGSRRIRRILTHTVDDRRRMILAGLNRDRVEVVRHGIPNRPTLPTKQDAKRKLGLDGRFVVTLFGFLSRRKGHGLAIEAMTGVCDNAVLLLAGGQHPDDRSEYTQLLNAQIKSVGLNDRVRVTGYLPDDEVACVMAATDVVIAPFLESSGSGSLAMAFACGKAVIASDIAPHLEVLDEQQGALKLARNDPGCWAETLEGLISAPDERERLEQGAAEYGAMYTYGRMADDTVEVYRRALSNSIR